MTIDRHHRDVELMTVDQLAALLQVPRSTLWNWRYRGEGPPAIKVGKHVRWIRSDVNAWLDTCRDARSCPRATSEGNPTNDRAVQHTRIRPSASVELLGTCHSTSS